MTEAPETTLQRMLMAKADEIRELKERVAHLEAENKRLDKYRSRSHRNGRELTAYRNGVEEELAKAKEQAAHWQGKATKNRNEVARLTRENEQLKADKRNLTFDINKQRKWAEQLQERVQ